MELFKRHWLFLLITSLVLIILQYTPYLYHRWQTPPDRVYLGAERYTPDYYVYLFYLNQGAMGKTSVWDYYTNQPHDGSLVHVEYLVAGKIGSLFGLSLPATFYLFRTLTLLFYLLVSFWFIGLFLKNELLHKLTFLLSWFWGGVGGYFDFYQPPDLINRLTFEPHKFLGMSLFLIILYLFSSFWLVQNPSKKDSGVAEFIPSVAEGLPRKTLFFCLLLLAGFIHGVTAISLIFTVLFYLFFMLLISVLDKKSLRNFLVLLIPLFPLILLLSLPLLYWQLVFTQNPVWQAVSLWERHFAQADSLAPLLPTVLGYLVVLGPLIVLAAIGLTKFLREHKKLGLLLLSFLLSNLFLFFVGYIFLGTTKHRYYQTPYLSGWSVLAMYGITTLLHLSLRGEIPHRHCERSEAISMTVRDKLRNLKNTQERLPRSSTALGARNDKLVLTVICLLLALGIPNFKQGLDTQLYQFGTPPHLDSLGYPAVGWYQGLLWMQKNTKQNSVVLSLPIAGQIIPALPGRRVVVGDYVHTYHYFDKLPQVTSFFKGELSVDQARNYLQQENVNFVFTGFEEKAQGNLTSYFAFLQPIFNNSEVTVYKVRSF